MKSQPFRRKIKYIDETLQKWLLVGLVVLEAGLVGELSWVMQFRLNQVIEKNVFRVHLAEAEPMLRQLLHQALPMLGIFLIVNALALLFAHLIWNRYVKTMLSLFMKRVGKSQRLDFSLDRDEPDPRYELVKLIETLRAKERVRLAAIRTKMSVLEEEISDGDPQHIRQVLHGLGELLPPKT